MTNSDVCVQPHDTDRQALPSLRLCRPCHDRLRRDLADLGRLYVELERVLPAGSTPQYGQRVSGSSSRPLPVNPAVADLRDQIRHDLAWWVRYVAERRGITALPDDRIDDIAAWLGRHVDWIAAHETAAAQCPPVIRELTGRARNLLDPNRRLPTGERCRMVTDSGKRCTGTITMVQKPGEIWTAHCSECGPQEAAPYLRDKVAGRWVTRERVAAYALRRHGVRIGLDTVRQWAARGHIASTTHGGATWYDLGTVEDYLRRRQPMAS